MSNPINSIKNFRTGGMDTDDAITFVQPNDYLEGYNIRQSGTSEGEDGYTTNIESNEEIEGTQPDGINKCIGTAGFESIRKVISFHYNSQLFHQIKEIDYDTNVERVLFTNKTDSGGINILPLNPSYHVLDIKLINDKYLLFNDAYTPPHLVDLDRLRSGGYGTLTEEDFVIIKKQNLMPINGEYGDDSGRASNFLSNKLFQFRSQFLTAGYTYSAWSMSSERFVPDSESTPSVGTDVSKNNVLILSVDIGNNRVDELNIVARYDNLYWFLIKNVSREYVTSLPDTEVDVANGIYEGYDETTNIYQFTFYNDGLYPPVAPLETDLPYDYVPLIAGAAEVLNGNIIALGDVTEGYDRPDTDVVVSASTYDPQIDVTIPPDDDNFKVAGTITDIFHGQPIDNDFRNEIIVYYSGVPQTGDVLRIRIANSTNANDTQEFVYTVPSGQDEDFQAVLNSYTTTLPNSSRSGVDGIRFYKIASGAAYYYLVYAKVENFSAGAGESKSIHALMDNSSYQLALSYRDAFGRFFPLVTGNNFIVKTPSFAQSQGLTPLINWTINTLEAPEGAVDYQWLLSENNTVETLLDVLASLIEYKGTWDASSNTPTLVAGTGGVGDVYQVTTYGEQNLGNGTTSYEVGDYVKYNGLTWDRVEKTIGDLTASSDYLFLNLTPLSNFNNRNSSSKLVYDYTQGDRITLHYYINGTTKIYVNNPAVDVEIVGYDPAAQLLKIRKVADYDTAPIEGKNLYVRLYTPKKRPTETVDNTQTVFYEIGQRYEIVDGEHSVLNGTITKGDVYFKTREYQGAIDPDELYSVLATSFSFSDFYVSNYNNYGRPRYYNDVLERTERKASIRYSDVAVLGSHINGLTRFYGERIYGDGEGQSTSNYGAIRVLYQRNNILVCIQELKVGYIPVYNTIIEDNAEQQQLALSDKLLNNIRYNTSGNIGIGNAKESFVAYNNNLYWIDPYRSEPIRGGLDGVAPISGKMTKYFKTTLQQAYGEGKKIIGLYDIYNNEYVISIEQEGDSILSVPFVETFWEYLEPYTIAPSDVTGNTDPPHGTVSYNSGTGIATYTPDNNYTGTDSSTFSFTVDGDPNSKKGCVTVIAGDTTPNQFVFTDLTNQAPSQTYYSNSINIDGINIPVAISIVNGQYSINGGTWTSAAGTVENEDRVQVRLTSSALPSTTISATLTVSGVSDSFDVTTAPVTVTQYILNNYGQPINVTTPAPVTVDIAGYDTYTTAETGSFTLIAGDGYSSTNVNIRVYDPSTYDPNNSGTYTAYAIRSNQTKVIAIATGQMAEIGVTL